MTEIPTADRQNIRDVNLRAVLETLRRHGPSTRASISRETGLSGATVSAVVSVLVEAGLVSSIGEGPATGGRRGSSIELDAEARSILAVDLSAGPPRHALVDMYGAIIPKSARAVPADAIATPAAFVSWLQERASEDPRLIGVGVAVPGVIVAESGVVEWAPRLSWREAQLLGDVGQSLPQHAVVIENDLNLAALSEYEFGAHDTRDLAMLGIHGGLGAGIILDGRLHRGVHSAAGEVGYLPARGGRGSRDFGELETELFDRLDDLNRGDESATAEIIELLLLACRAIAVILDVGTIVLGDEISLGRESLSTELEQRLSVMLPHAPAVTTSALGSDGTLRGAGAAVHRVIQSDIRRLLA